MVEDTARQEVFEAGCALIEQGFPIVATVGKKPTWDGKHGAQDWQSKPFSEADLEAALRDNSEPGIGLKLGPQAGFIDIEADSPEEEQAFQELFDGCEVPLMPTYQSPRGKHRFFRWDDRLSQTGKAVVNFKGSKAKLGCRIGANGKGAQSVLPPSAGRKWLVPLEECDTPALPDTVIERLLGSKAASKSDFLIGEVPQRHRNETLFSLASSMRSQGHGYDSILQAVQRHNEARCKPPLGDDEVEAIAASAMRYPAGKQQELPKPPSLAKDIEEFTLAELQEKFPALHPPVIDGLLREGETANIIAPSKFGKSWGIYGLALSVITNSRWLDAFQAGWGRVLIVDNELHKAVLADRIPKVGDAMGLKRGDYHDDLTIWPLRGNLRSWLELSERLAKVERGYFKLIIFDAKYRFALPGVSESDNSADTLVYNTLDEIAASTGSAVAVVHHSSKGSQSDKRVTDVGSGAGAQSRAADCHIVLREHEEEGVAVLDAAVRSFPPVKPLAVRFDFPLWVPELSADPEKLAGNLTSQERKQKQRDEEGTRLILKSLAKGEATARSLRGSTKISRGRLERLLEPLEADGIVQVSQETKGGNKCNVYTLAE